MWFTLKTRLLCLSKEYVPYQFSKQLYYTILYFQGWNLPGGGFSFTRFLFVYLIACSTLPVQTQSSFRQSAPLLWEHGECIKVNLQTQLKQGVGTAAVNNQLPGQPSGRQNSSLDHTVRLLMWKIWELHTNAFTHLLLSSAQSWVLTMETVVAGLCCDTKCKQHAVKLAVFLKLSCQEPQTWHKLDHIPIW